MYPPHGAFIDRWLYLFPVASWARFKAIQCGVMRCVWWTVFPCCTLQGGCLFWCAAKEPVCPMDRAEPAEKKDKDLYLYTVLRLPVYKLYNLHL